VGIARLRTDWSRLGGKTEGKIRGLYMSGSGRAGSSDWREG